VAKDLKATIRTKARELGFDAIGFTRADLPPESRAHLQDFLATGQHGEMAWMQTRAEQRAHPQRAPTFPSMPATATITT